MLDEAPPAILAEVVRDGFVEGHHYGSVVVTSPTGAVECRIGTTGVPMLPRSTCKPMQVVGMLRAGLRLEPELVALAGGSHAGEPIHLAGVDRILAGVGLDESALRNPRALPVDSRELRSWTQAGRERSRIAGVCSGKHAAMLATSVRNGWQTVRYRDPEHPVQRAIRAAVAELAGEKVTAVVTDGCGAPAPALTLTGVARAFGIIAAADPTTPEGTVAAAFRTHPEYASGTRRPSAALMRSVPGLVCKTGAEGVFAAGLPDGRGLAVKIEDGASRARGVVLATVLRQLGVTNGIIERQCQYPSRRIRRRTGTVRPGAALAGVPPLAAG